MPKLATKIQRNNIAEIGNKNSREEESGEEVSCL